MSELPLISIVIPTYNAGKYLGQCLASIKRQGYPRVEVLVVDGGSTDETSIIVERYNNLISCYITEPDSGQADAVTKGLRLATGDIAHWHAADDVLLPGALQVVAAEFSRNPDLDLVFSDGIAFDGKGIFRSGPHLRFLNFWTTLLFFGRFQSDCAYWRHRITPSALPLDGTKPLMCDEDFFLRLWANRQSRWVTKRLGGFRIRDGQLSKMLSKDKLAEDRADTRQKVERALGIRAEERAGLRRRYWLRHVFGSTVAPALYSAFRYAMRVCTFDYRRRQFRKWFYGEWLREIDL